MATQYLTDQRTALQEPDRPDGVPESVDVWKRRLPVGTYQVDPVRSRAEFVTRAGLLYPVTGVFDAVSGTIDVREAIERSDVRISVEAAGVDTGVRLRDAHLRSATWLATRTYPTMGFTSEHVLPLGRHTYAVHGRMTIRDVTEPAVFHATLTDTYRQPDRTVARFVATAEVDRRAFGVPRHEAAALWGLLAASTTTVRLHVTAAIDAS